MGQTLWSLFQLSVHGYLLTRPFIQSTPIELTEDDIYTRCLSASLSGQDPSELYVQELKHWLKCRGAKLSGRKADLVKR